MAEIFSTTFRPIKHGGDPRWIADSITILTSLPKMENDHVARFAGTVWLWAAGAASQSVVAYVIHPKRSRLGLQALLGESITGILGSDRWGVYNRIAVAQ